MRTTSTFFLSTLPRMRCYAPMMPCPMPAVPVAPIPTRPSLSFTVTRRRARPRVVQDTAQTPRKTTLTYLDPLPPFTITAGVHTGLLCALQHLWPLPIFRRVPSLLESVTVLLSLRTFHFSLSVRHIQRLHRPCHLRGLRLRRPVRGRPQLTPASLVPLSTTHTPLRECHLVAPLLSL